MGVEQWNVLPVKSVGLFEITTNVSYKDSTSQREAYFNSVRYSKILTRCWLVKC